MLFSQSISVSLGWGHNWDKLNGSSFLLHLMSDVKEVILYYVKTDAFLLEDNETSHAPDEQKQKVWRC